MQTEVAYFAINMVLSLRFHQCCEARYRPNVKYIQQVLNSSQRSCELVPALGSRCLSSIDSRQLSIPRPNYIKYDKVHITCSTYYLRCVYDTYLNLSVLLSAKQVIRYLDTILLCRLTIQVILERRSLHPFNSLMQLSDIYSRLSSFTTPLHNM